MKRPILLLMVIAIAGCSKSEDQVQNINKALTTMLKFDQALAVYRLDQSGYPTTDNGLQALVESPASATNWNGPYLEGSLPLDPWGNPYAYEHGAEIYRITTAGPDGEFGSHDDMETKQEVELESET